MARIAVGTYMIRQPVGGNVSWSLQWLAGLKDLGHEVFALENAYYPDPCFDLSTMTMTEDPSCGIRTVTPYLERFGLEDAWCYRDNNGVYHGMSARQVADVFASADIFIDLGTHGSWIPEAGGCGTRVLIDGEPGYTQMKMELGRTPQILPPSYDYYYSNGANMPTEAADAPKAGIAWRHVFNPVFLDLFPVTPAPAGAPFSTVMNWQAHDPIRYNGLVYGQKDVEFAKFIGLPRRCKAPLEVAVSGKKIPHEELALNGWRVRDAREVTLTVERYYDYIRCSAGEFSVCKNIFAATATGWFSDRSAAYLASARPVIVQDTGFGSTLPTGEGLFSVGDVDAAASAIAAVVSDWKRHSRAARAIAESHLSTRAVLTKLLDEL